jgi:hypothetical protein
MKVKEQPAFDQLIKQYLSYALVDRKAASQWAFFSPSTRRDKGVFGKAGRALNRTPFCENETPAC